MGKCPYGHMWRFKPRNIPGTVLDSPHCLSRYTVHLLHSAPGVWPLPPLWLPVKAKSQEVRRLEENETRVFIFLALYYAVSRQWPYALTKDRNSWQAAISYSPSPDTFSNRRCISLYFHSIPCWFPLRKSAHILERVPLFLPICSLPRSLLIWV